MRLALVCFYCLCVFVYVLYFIATMSFAGYFLPVLFCMLSMLISDSRFDLVWFRLSCDHGWIRSGSVNVRKQQQQQQQLELGLRDVRGDTGNSVAQHRTNSPGALNVKASAKTREHDCCREHCISREPLGYYFGKRVLFPECWSRWPWSDVFSTWTSPRGCINKGVLDFLSGDKTMYCTKLVLERAEQDGETIQRAAHRSRAQAWRSS